MSAPPLSEDPLIRRIVALAEQGESPARIHAGLPSNVLTLRQVRDVVLRARRNGAPIPSFDGGRPLKTALRSGVTIKRVREVMIPCAAIAALLPLARARKVSADELIRRLIEALIDIGPAGIDGLLADGVHTNNEAAP